MAAARSKQLSVSPRRSTSPKKRSRGSPSRDSPEGRREAKRDSRAVKRRSPDLGEAGRRGDGDRERERRYERPSGGRDRERERNGERLEDGRGRERGQDSRREERRRSPADRRGGDAPAEAAVVDNGQVPAAAAAAAAPAPAPAPAVPRRVVDTGKTGGVYIPPFKLARMMQDVEDRSSPEYQRLTWEALKKSLNGIINKVNINNIKNILAEVFRENLIRGRGLFCRSMMKSQMASPAFSHVYAALVSVVNTKFPELGELLLSRLVLQFKRSYKRNDKPVCVAAAKFIAHLINQGVAHEVLALEMLIVMLENPTDDGVEMSVEFMKEVGAHLQAVAATALHSVFERFRAILHEGRIDKRVQFIIEGLFAIRKAGFEVSGFISVKPELDLIDDDTQVTHNISLDDELNAQMALDVFRVDPDFVEEERRFAAISHEILGLDSDDEAAGGGGGGGDDGDDDDEGGEDESEDEEEVAAGAAAAAQQQQIQDQTMTNLVNLRRTLYLTLMSSFDFEEAGHKLMKVPMAAGQEVELVTMIIECCAQERTYKRFFGLLAARFCFVGRVYQDLFEDCFVKQYAVIHRLETGKLRNIASLFAQMLAADALPWSALSCISLTEADTTSSSRIFIKYLFQELSSTMGLLQLNKRLGDKSYGTAFDGIFPQTSPADMRFSINFFTSIGLGGLTDRSRDDYRRALALQAQQQAAAAAAKAQAGSSSSSSSSDSDSSSSDSSSSSSSDSSSSDSSGSDSD